MKGAEENAKSLNLSLQTTTFYRDLLHKSSNATTTTHIHPNSSEVVNALNDVEEDELELTLGLSMNGRFGVDPNKKKKKMLKRSSSISNFPFKLINSRDRNDDGSHHHARDASSGIHAPPIPRTRSLPTEAEEELRKRKTYQSMSRFEARKKRLEKMKSGGGGGLMRLVKDNKDVNSEVVGGNKSCDNNNGGGLGNKYDGGGKVVVNGNENVELQRSGSSGSSDLDQGQQMINGPKQNTEISPTSIPQSPEQSSQVTTRPPLDRTSSVVAKESLNNNAMFDMPHVTTKEAGPNGRKVEGFLYRYKKGEEVCIVCVCHGMFLSPAEFVKHGGGGSDVEHPLKHIVVNPFPLV